MSSKRQIPSIALTACCFPLSDYHSEKNARRRIVARIGDERRVHVVTIGAPAEIEHIHRRWPRIVRGQAAGE